MLVHVERERGPVETSVHAVDQPAGAFFLLLLFYLRHIIYIMVYKYYLYVPVHGTVYIYIYRYVYLCTCA